MLLRVVPLVAAAARHLPASRAVARPLLMGCSASSSAHAQAAMSSSSSALVHVNTKDAPQAIGPYSQAVVANGFAFVSGQIPLTADGKLKAGNIKEQTALVLQNLSAVLKAAGASLNTVVKTTVYLKDMNDFAAMNEVYAEKFGDARPARAAIQVARLPKDVSVEIDAVAVVDQAKL